MREPLKKLLPFGFLLLASILFLGILLGEEIHPESLLDSKLQTSLKDICEGKFAIQEHYLSFKTARCSESNDQGLTDLMLTEGKNKVSAVIKGRAFSKPKRLMNTRKDLLNHYQTNCRLREESSKSLNKNRIVEKQFACEKGDFKASVISLRYKVKSSEGSPTNGSQSSGKIPRPFGEYWILTGKSTPWLAAAKLTVLAIKQEQQKPTAYTLLSKHLKKILTTRNKESLKQLFQNTEKAIPPQLFGYLEAKIGELPVNLIEPKIAVGGNHSCLLNQFGKVNCWGDTYNLDSSPKGAFLDIDANSDYLCGIRINNTLSCWGEDKHSDDLPATSGKLQKIGGGCGIDRNNQLVCLEEHVKPPKGSFTKVEAPCALDTNQNLHCWGRGPWVEEHGYHWTEQGSFHDLATGVRHVCALDESNQIRCWGNNGNGNIKNRDTYTKIEAAPFATCGLTEKQDIECWGGWRWNKGTKDVPPGEYLDFDIGGPLDHVQGCAIQRSGGVECWGKDDDGETRPPSRLKSW